MKPIIKTSLSVLTGLALAGTAFAQAPTISYSTPQAYVINTSITPLTPTVTNSPSAYNGYTTTLAGNNVGGHIDGTGSGASFNQPLGVATDAAGNIYVADAGSHTIRKVTPAGVVTTIAGTTNTSGFVDGQGTSAKFYHPVGIAVDASGNIYVADEDNNAIRKISPSGYVSTLAGGTQGSQDGTGSGAQFYYPCGVAVDASGNVYVADNSNNKIRKVTSAGVVTTFAGSGAAGSADNTGTLATFNQPFAIAIDGTGNLYVADRFSQKIRKINSSAIVTTIAGTGTAGFADGAATTTAMFKYPTAIAVDAAGNVYVADEQNNRIRRITSGTVYTLAGTGTAGNNNGGGSTATFSYPFGMAINLSGQLFIGDYNYSLVRQTITTAYTISSALPTGLTFNSGTGVISGTPTVLSSPVIYTITGYNGSGFGFTSLTMEVDAAGPSSSQNYILTYSPRIALTAASSLASQTISNVNRSIQYVDGLGRPEQVVQVQASPTQRDLVQPIAYDAYDREASKYLPYTVLPTAVSDGRYNPAARGDESSFYANPANASTWNAPGVAATNFPTSVTSFEASPLNRPVEKGAPGDSWQFAGTAGANNPGHTVKVVYATNNASSLTSGTGYWAKNYGVTYLYTYDGHYLYKNSLADNGSYGLDVLYVTVTKNENWSASQSNPKWNTTEDYKDKFGRLVLKRIYNYNTSTGQTETLSTYYVYDEYNNLTYVLPPGANPDAGGISQTTLDNYCYQYRYDGRNRIVGKKVPGKGWELTLYNKLDKAVATQDSVQRMKSPQEWSIIKYDAMGRKILTGIYQYAGSTVGVDYRTTLQSLVDAQSAQWETAVTTGNGYTATTWPTAWTTTLSINYYDNYSAIPSLPYTYSSGSNMTRGLLTASKTAVLNAPTNMLWAQSYYDDQDRQIKKFKQHYLGAVASGNNYDDITTGYDFTGAVTSMVRKHYVNGPGNVLTLNVTVTNSFNYDQVGRKTKSFMQVNSGTNVMLAQYVYNEVGQLYQKKLHSEDNGANFIETVTDSYNPRGWTSEINSTHFDEKLYYDTPSGTVTGVQGNFTGDVTEAWYNSPSVVNKGFIYTYDNLSRLVTSKYYQGSTYSGSLDETLSYDVMGNIKTLTRGSYGTQSYTYSGTFSYSSYTGNQVNTITNNGSAYRSYTYDGNGNVLSNGGYSFDYNMLNLPLDVKQNGTAFNTYTYDANGSKLRKVSTASGNTTDYISGIQYKNGAIDFIATEEGRYEMTGSPAYQYDLKDHLGTVRVMIQKNTASTATVIQEQEYYAFGLNVTRYDNSTNNKYLYNGKELQDESNLNMLDYGARLYDPITARWNAIDPLAEMSTKFSPYNYTENNPVRDIDPDGMDTQVGGGWTLEQLQQFYGGEVQTYIYSPDDNNNNASTPAGSTYVNKYGDVIAHYNDNSNNVYEIDNPTDQKQIDQARKAGNLNAGGELIGQLGGKINANKIITNLLARNSKIAKGLYYGGWLGNVLPHTDWDLKNNKKTIFGVAWAYDQTHSSKPNTFFIYKNFSKDGNFTAADVGNYHAGYMGIAAGVPIGDQETWAGLGEIAKFRSPNDMIQRLTQIATDNPPYGDQPVDYYWNSRGMADAQKAGLHPDPEPFDYEPSGP